MLFICEEAADGNLTDYLDKPKTAERTLVWRKLLEAALGLGFLHQNKIVHGDLKCNQILVGGDGIAKLTDFGLIFVSTGSMPNGSGGAIRWRALECLGCNGHKPTVESDVYSFGMCVVEAVTYDVPWGVYLADIAIMDHLQHGKFLSRPKQFANDAEWKFVLALCEFDPVKRIKLEDAIKQLQRLAQGLSISPKPMLVMNRMNRLLKKESLEKIRISQLHQYQAKALRRVSAEKILRFLRMILERKIFLRVVYAVRVLQCRFRYHRLVQCKRAAEYSIGHNPIKPEIHSTQSSWPTSTMAASNKESYEPQESSGDQQNGPFRLTDVSNRSPWINDEDRFNCYVCIKDFTVFRRKHHCRVCFEIICHKASLTRKKMRICLVCAGMQSTRNVSPLITSTPLDNGKDGFFHKTGDFFTGIGTLFRTKKRETKLRAIDERVCDLQSYDSSWKDEGIVAVRIPGNPVTVQRIISRGGFGLVHLDIWNDMQVAVKTFLPESRKNIVMINEFLAEAKLLATMEHPCIVNLIGVAWDSLADVCIVVEYMGGGDLRALLDRYERTQHPVGKLISPNCALQ